jgi:phosphoribosylamine--glycine ligase
MTLVQPTRIVVVGFGGREHALAWKFAGEPGVNTVWAIPGSHGIGDEPRVETMSHLGRDSIEDGTLISSLARGKAAELVVIGPEAPLAAGVVDTLLADGVVAFGPTAAAARIESSKAFCREIAEAAGVAIAPGRAFDDPDAASAHARELAAAGNGVVVKADGLAAGKGVTVCDDAVEAEREIAALFDVHPRGRVVVEQRLDGREASVIAICDGTRAVALPAARDHKRLLDGDEGPNTGGMGAYSPLPDLTDDAVDDIVTRVHLPLLAELARRGTPFRGFLYAGLMLTADGPVLLECNARLGDPEAQVILPRLAVALGPWLRAAAGGALPATAPTRLPVLPGATVGIVLAAEGYPAEPRTGAQIAGLEAPPAEGTLVFHSGTDRNDAGEYRTRGGRVLTVVGRGPDLAAARSLAERAAGSISWPGMQRRRDIAADTSVAAGAAR